MKKIWRTIWHYNLFFAAAATALIALGLDIKGWDLAAHWLLIVVCALQLLPLLAEMYHDLRAGKYGVDILVVVAIGSSVVLHEYWAAIVLIIMVTGGRALEHYASHRAQSELEALLSSAPQKAHVLRGRKEIDIKASEVRTGDKIVIRPGELVPVDAIILEGTASFNESSLTGESEPQVKEVGATLLSGSVNLDGVITAKANASAEDSQYQQIIRLVKSAQGSEAPFVRLADRYALPFTIVSFAIAITAWVISGHAIRFLEVLVVATPCPLILAAPIAIISGMSRSAKQGIIIKNGTALEKLARAKTFAFDKTGTLTLGQLRVERVTTFGKFKQTEVLGLAASLERGSNHAQADAIVARAEAENAKSHAVKHVREIVGKGVTAMVSGKEVIVGRLTLLEEKHVAVPKTFKASNHNQTVAFVSVGGELAGAITFHDEVRPNSKSTLAELRAAGVKHFMMVTGDNEQTAKTIAKQLGIEEVVANALPGDKIRALENVKDRPVAFVGDGVNDAPVLTASDVGIALGARGASAASESADVVVMLDDVSRVARGVRIAQRSVGIAKQSVLIGIGLSVGLMLVFATGKFKPIYGAAIQEVVDVVVIFNALRAHTGGRTKSKR
jgi:heavy metal translocating P-type ATPase